MKRTLITTVATAVLIVTGIIVWSQRASALPYYGGKDFTPSWAPVAHRVADFGGLTDQRGQAFSNAQLDGHPYVASFIFTRCSLVCPVLVKQLGRVQAVTQGSDLRIVSFSVTPDVDTPDVLADFGQKRGIDPSRWSLLTGSKQTIYGLARDSYFADDDRITASLDEPNAFLHTEKLVLVDAQGHLRGVYDGTLPHDIDLLIKDAKALAR